ncbi:kinase-like domain-containing protein [Mucor mucedo]|uniref:kinase-like domain-containing protein n=1 Tax=Mucor mucedo TaxID=29922 RepID=UPI00222050F9|nr:kinase-like domain-containing protein [Mucor mucedo]KAI7895356.1 kinase-like domain-containing protein [Mucor mucedo]
MTHLGSPHDAYDFIEQIGDGSFGTVHKAKNKISHKLVAVKVMKKKYSCIEECQGQFEPKLLVLLPSHLNIVQLYDSFLSPNCDLSFIMEYMDGGNLYQLMRERRHHSLPFNHCELRNILHQILSAVSHIHHHQVFHRDMKPENLLLDYKTGRPIIKLADFGLARELKSRPPYTEYVSTRWYRAPEVLLRSTEYSAPVDLWAIGAIFAELITLEPLFPGESEIDQIYRICEILGSPGNKLGIDVGQKQKLSRQGEKRASPGFARKKVKEVPTVTTASTLSLEDGGGEWKEGVRLAYKIGFKFPQLEPKPLESVVPNATESMLDLIRHFLFFNPSQRWSADHALGHAFFSEVDEPVHLPTFMEPITPPDKYAHSVSTTPNCKPPITPLDLLTTPQSPYQVCPDWNTDRPVSRYGRLCSAIKDAPETTTETGWHAQQSRPIYSSHQKIHPVTDRPNSITATVAPKRYSDEFMGHTHRHLHHHHDHLLHNPTTPFMERIPHYGSQLVKWAPPRLHYHQPSIVVDPELSRPESRRCRSPAPFSSQLMKHKYTTTTHTAQSTYRNSTSHRFNLWVPETEEEEEEEEVAEPFDRSVFLPMALQ